MDIKPNFGQFSATSTKTAQQNKTSLYEAQQALKFAGDSHPAGSHQADQYRKKHKDWPFWTDS